MPKYTNSIHVYMSHGGGPNNGETTIEFKHVFRENKSIDNENGCVPANSAPFNNESVASVVMTRDMACILRDSLNNALTQLEIEDRQRTSGNPQQL